MGNLEPLEFFSERSCCLLLRSGNLDLDKRTSFGGVRVLLGCDRELYAHLPGFSLSNRYPRRSGGWYFHGDLVPKASFTSSRLSASGLGTVCLSIFLCGCIHSELPGWHSFCRRPCNRSPDRTTIYKGCSLHWAKLKVATRRRVSRLRALELKIG